MLNKVKNTIEKYGLIRKGDKILVGVSGGPDSVALLYILNTLRKKGAFHLHIAHLDHMLRKNSTKDAEFVKKLSVNLKIPLRTGRINVKKLAKNQSIEEAGRNARLDFFFKTAEKIKADKIALAHNLEDQAETVLMRILRGTGLYGLSGISAKRKIRGYEIIRPLIETKRSEIESYLKKNRIKSRLDRSNFEDIYFRNRIRNKLIPLLEKNYSPNIKELLANLAVNSGSDYQFLEHLAAKAIKKTTTKFNLKALSQLHISMQRLLFRRAIACLQGDTRRITFRHINEIEDLVLNRPKNSIVDLPKGISVIKKKSLVFYRR
ncbi:MAG: tRNA lysidine(34) synthetase TilS [Candidatus Omnitrophota bacterium]|jgi:tRNA(Ile)-lysidine synthase